jgi:hypothetical protein
VIDVGRCRHCGLPVRSSLREPAHLAAVRLQTALLEIKRNGIGSLAGIDQFGWSTAETRHTDSAHRSPALALVANW